MLSPTELRGQVGRGRGKMVLYCDVLKLNLVSLTSNNPVVRCCSINIVNVPSGQYTHKNATNLQQTSKSICCNNLSAGCARTGCPKLVDKLLQACSRLATRLMNSTALLQVVPTTLLSGCKSTSCESQTWYNLTKKQLVDKLVTSLLRAQLVDKMWDFYVCTISYIYNLNFKD